MRRYGRSRRLCIYKRGDGTGLTKGWSEREKRVAQPNVRPYQTKPRPKKAEPGGHDETSTPRVFASGYCRCGGIGGSAPCSSTSLPDESTTCPRRNRAASNMAKHRLAWSRSWSFPEAGD